SMVSVRNSGRLSSLRGPPRTDFGGRSMASASPSSSGSSGSQHQAPWAPPCTRTSGAGTTLGELLAVLDDRDRLGRAALGGEDDLVLGLRGRVEHDGDAVVVEVEHARRPERAVARAHALLAVDLDLQAHGS